MISSCDVVHEGDSVGGRSGDVGGHSDLVGGRGGSVVVMVVVLRRGGGCNDDNNEDNKKTTDCDWLGRYSRLVEDDKGDGD